MKYVVAKGYYGLGGSIAVLSSAMRLADRSGAKLIVDWVDGVYGIEGKDVFNEIFSEPQSNIDVLMSSEMKVWPEEWQDDYKSTMPHKTVNGLQLSKVTSEMVEESGELDKENYNCFVVSRDDKYWHDGYFREEVTECVRAIKPVDRVARKIDSYKLGEDCIGVHFRHGNGERTVVPPDINWFFGRVDDFLCSSPSSNILVCTDCSKVLDAFEERYPGKVISTEKSYPEVGSGSMHLSREGDQRLQAIEEAVIDIWLMAKCGFFVGSKSFFTGVALKLRGNIDKAKVKIWQPIWRSHKPEQTEVPLSECSDLSKSFDDQKILKDGLFVKVDGALFRIRYLYCELGEYSSVEDIDFQWLKKELIEHRCY